MEKVEKDFEELLQLFNKNGVKYCIIGAYAVAFYAIPRYTKDMAILVEPDAENAERIIKALEEFGFKNVGLTTDDFMQHGKIVQLGYEPVRVDILTTAKGFDFEKAWKSKTIGTYGDEKVYFVSLNDLIKMKQKSNRKQDLVDVEVLKKANNRRKR